MTIHVATMPIIRRDAGNESPSCSGFQSGPESRKADCGPCRIAQSPARGKGMGCVRPPGGRTPWRQSSEERALPSATGWPAARSRGAHTPLPNLPILPPEPVPSSLAAEDPWKTSTFPTDLQHYDDDLDRSNPSQGGPLFDRHVGTFFGCGAAMGIAARPGARRSAFRLCSSARRAHVGPLRPRLPSVAKALQAVGDLDERPRQASWLFQLGSPADHDREWDISLQGSLLEKESMAIRSDIVVVRRRVGGEEDRG